MPQEGEEMSKSPYGNSNLYMTTREFADLVINALHEQNYFKYDEAAHPGDIAFAFSTVAETIGTTMSWAIMSEAEARKETQPPVYTSSVTTTTGSELADDIDYSNWKLNKVRK